MKNTKSRNIEIQVVKHQLHKERFASQLNAC